MGQFVPNTELEPRFPSEERAAGERLPDVKHAGASRRAEVSGLHRGGHGFSKGVRLRQQQANAMQRSKGAADSLTSATLSDLSICRPNTPYTEQECISHRLTISLNTTAHGRTGASAPVRYNPSAITIRLCCLHVVRLRKTH